MIKYRGDLNHLRNIFILAQAGVLLGSVAILFVVMILSYREKVIHNLMAKLDALTETTASQLRANQVPLSSNTDQGVFIINQNDGTVVIDRHYELESDKKLWESYRSKLIYEMQKQKRGWIVYPDKVMWDFAQEQKIIRYLSINELNWILAIETQRPTELELFHEAIKPAVYWTMIFLAIFGVALLWWMTTQYFAIIKKHVSQTVESNLMSLGGEEKVWDKFSDKEASSVTQDLQSEAIGMVNPPPPAPEPHAKDFFESQLPKAAAAFEQPKPVEKEQIKETRKEDPAADQLTINENDIQSPVLKKMLKKFRQQ